MVDAAKLDRINQGLTQVLEDSDHWRSVLVDLVSAFKAMGASILPAAPRPDFWWSPSMDAAFAEYLKEGWAEIGRDPYKRTIRRHQKGLVSTDNHVYTEDERIRHPYKNDFMVRHKLGPWLGAPVSIGNELYSISFHADIGAPEFTPEDAAALAQFAPRISELATLSAQIARGTLQGVTGALEHLGKPALALDLSGRVLAANPGAEGLMTDDFMISQGSLRISDRKAASQLEALVSYARWHPDGVALKAPVILVQRESAPAVLMRALPIDAAARCYFLGARLLLLLAPVGASPRVHQGSLQTAFGLTAAEARLAVRLSQGEAIAEAADALAISKETARTQAKAVYSKTGVHRQSELVAMLLSLPWPKKQT